MSASGAREPEPRPRSEEAPRAGAARVPREDVDAAGLEEALRILIVDDDFLFTDMLPRLLRREVAFPMLHITAVRSAEEARNVARAHRFDIVLCDFDLRSKQSGIDVLTDVAKAPGRPFRILISGHSPREIPDVPGAFDAFLDKPMTLREVVPQLAALLEERLGIRLERRG